MILTDRFGRLPLAPVIGLVLLAAACGGALAEQSAPAAAEFSGNGVTATAAASGMSEIEGSQGKGQLAPAAPESPESKEPAQAKRQGHLGPAPGIEPDPDYKEALENSGLSTLGWDTDFTLHSVAFDEIMSGGPPRDGIPPLDSPSFVSPDDADAWLANREPVISFELNGEAKAYPLQILTWHEIVNDEVGGVPVIVTFCPCATRPLCSTAGWTGWSSTSAHRAACGTAT